MYDVYVPFEENLDADWLPYNCTIVEYDIFFKDGEYYYEGEEPDDSVRGERTFEYKEGKLVNHINMYFIYKKQINVASEYSYNVDSIVEWFKDYIDQDDAHGGVEEVTAKDIVDDIFCESDFWYDDFIQNFDIESDVIENMYPEDIAEQLKEIVGDKLIWSEIRQVSVEEDTLYSALLYIYRTYIGTQTRLLKAFKTIQKIIQKN